MALSVAGANRLGFIILGLTNNFAYVIMLSAAYDLLASTSSHSTEQSHVTEIMTSTTSTTMSPSISPFTIDVSQQTHHPVANSTVSNSSVIPPKPHCNEHSTSTILLADTLPSLTTKLIYPFLLVNLPTAYKAIATAGLTAAAFIITGLSASQLLIFTGVVCASLSSGLGESAYLSMTPSYGDVSLSGWSMGTGAAGLLGAMAYAILRMILSIKVIMIVMLVVPVAMLVAYFCIIVPVDSEEERTNSTSTLERAAENSLRLQPELRPDPLAPFDLNAKIAHLSTLSKYFMPLLLVYFAEYFINQGLFEIIYYPEITYLDHASQYRWFQVSYQLGVLISRSSLDLFRIKNIWAMSILQFANTILFLLHTAKIIHLPSFYLVLGIIVYEGLLGGFTYVNAFYRVKNEVEASKREFSISTVTVADSLGIVMAGLLAMPVHDALCKLY